MVPVSIRGEAQQNCIRVQEIAYPNLKIDEIAQSTITSSSCSSSSTLPPLLLHRGRRKHWGGLRLWLGERLFHVGSK